jgi:hypothetical protein
MVVPFKYGEALTSLLAARYNINSQWQLREINVTNTVKINSISSSMMKEIYLYIFSWLSSVPPAKSMD